MLMLGTIYQSGKNGASIFSKAVSSVKMEIIESPDVFKLLFHLLEKWELMSSYIFEELCGEYICFQKIHSIVWEFRNLLNDNPDELAPWLRKAQSLKIREINSFVDGVKRDFEAVFNAIKFDYNYGLAEGKVNMLTLIKLIIYGLPLLLPSRLKSCLSKIPLLSTNLV